LEIEGDKAKMYREIEGGKEEVEAVLPIVIGCQEPIAEWKIPNMKGIMTARSKPLKVVEPAGENLTITNNYTLPSPKGAVKMIDASNAGQLIELLRSEAKVL
ncbi:MAG: electron transfer flavoprotein beta subunit/FixA family protein, partial [Pseudarcicella sp.]|nr:electron transfer flavoprotein beta subunit/FixA family protein [Pseudarcicella sp.]